MSDTKVPSPTNASPSHPGPEWLAVWTILALGAILFRGRHFVDLLKPQETVIVDFFQEWASAKNYWTGQPIYRHQKLSLKEYLGGVPTKGLFIEYNAHPPTSVLMVLPFGLMEYPDAVLCWNLVSLASMIGAGILIIWQLQLKPGVWVILPLITFTLTAFPFLQQFRQGQMNLVLLLLITGSWAAARSQRSFLAGILLGLATGLKLFPGFLFLYFLLRRRWRVVFAGSVTLPVLGVASVAILGFQSYVDNLTVGLPYLAQMRNLWTNLSLPGFFSKLFAPLSPPEKTVPLLRLPLLAHALALAGIAVIVLVTGRMTLRAASAAEQDLAFSTALTAMLLISLITWPHYLLLLPLTFLLLWRHLPEVGISRWWLAPVLLLFWAPPFFFLGLSGLKPEFRYLIPAKPWQVLTVMSLQFYALLTLFMLNVQTLRCLQQQPALEK